MKTQPGTKDENERTFNQGQTARDGTAKKTKAAFTPALLPWLAGRVTHRDEKLMSKWF